MAGANPPGTAGRRSSQLRRRQHEVTRRTAAALGEVPTVVLVGGTMLAGLYWITNRRREVALAEAAEKLRKDGYSVAAKTVSADEERS